MTEEEAHKATERLAAMMKQFEDDLHPAAQILYQMCREARDHLWLVTEDHTADDYCWRDAEGASREMTLFFGMVCYSCAWEMDVEGLLRFWPNPGSTHSSAPRS